MRAAVATDELAEAVGPVDGVEVVVWNGDGPAPEGDVELWVPHYATRADVIDRGHELHGPAGRPAAERGVRRRGRAAAGRDHPLQRHRRARRRHRRARGGPDPGQPARDPRVRAPARPLAVAARAPVARRLPRAGPRLRLDRPGPGRAAAPDEGRRSPPSPPASATTTWSAGSAPSTTCRRCCPTRTSWSRSSPERRDARTPRRRALALLPDGALVVNVARGPVLDTDAVLRHAGRLRFALDVTDPEPLPDGHPLWDAPDVLITPHIAGGTTAMLPRISALVRDQLRRGWSPANRWSTSSATSLRTMHVTSLGFRTDLALLTASGSVVEDRGTHLVVRSPDNPSYFWGNFLLLAQPPSPAASARWSAPSTPSSPLADHVSIGIDTADLTDDARAAFEAAGMTVDVATVLTASDAAGARARSRPRSGALEGDDEWEAPRPAQPAALPADLRGGVHGVRAPEERPGAAPRRRRSRPALRRLRRRRARLAPPASSSPRTGSRASRASRPTPSTAARGWPRPSSTRPGQHALDQLGVRTLVIVADTDGEAIGIYRRLGFADTERQLMLEKRQRRVGVDGRLSDRT